MELPISLRAAGLNERRCIARHDLGYYGYLVVGAVYTSVVGLDRSILTKALKKCIDIHPMLSAGIKGAGSETPEFVRPAALLVQDHIHYFDPANNDASYARTISEHIKQLLLQLYNQRSDDYEVQPPWCVGVLPLAPVAEDLSKRTMIALAYSHSHGDGASGLAFHKSLLKALNEISDDSCPYTSETKHATCTLPMPQPLELAGNLSISWTYLLSTLLGEYAPKAIARCFGLDASSAGGVWRAKPAFYDPGISTTNVEVLQVSSSLLQRVLTTCRAHRVTFTGLLHQLIVRALSEALPGDTPAYAFIAQTAIDLRKHLVGIISNDMGVYASGISEVLPRRSAGDLANVWDEARNTSLSLARSAGSLHNQPVGLLRFLKEIRAWLAGKIGKARGASYELSNILAFDVEQQEEASWQVGEVFFSQPFDAVDSPLSFNVVSRTGGDLILTLSWQVGALDVEDETKFSQHVCRTIQELLEACATV